MVALGAVGLGLALTLALNPETENTAMAQGDGGAVQPAEQDGVQAQARGPVHEAYAEPGSAPQATPVVAKKPPEPVEELPPDQKPEGDNMHWITGYWSYDIDRADFIWVSGCWRAYPPGRTWMPGHWAEATGGWQWVPGFWAETAQQQTSLLPAPPTTLDAGPSAPAPTAGSVYANGCWIYQTHRYVWRPGYWYTPRVGWVWTPARYVWTPAGYVFIDGYWDYSLETRGCLFAPVVIERRFWGRPRWIYRPACVIYQPALVCSLFVRPACGCYFFGDYFEARYRKLGFVAWVDFRIGRSCYDPLFAHCRWQYRSDRLWERNLRTVYVNRYNGTYPRPPRTFVQQTTVINNIRVNNTTYVRNVTMMAPLSRVDRTLVKLQPVPRATLAREQKASQELRALARQRQQTAAGLSRRDSGVGRMPLPHVSPALRPTPNIKAPPHPQRPVRPGPSNTRPRREPRSEPRKPLTNTEHKSPATPRPEHRQGTRIQSGPRASNPSRLRPVERPTIHSTPKPAVKEHGPAAARPRPLTRTPDRPAGMHPGNSAGHGKTHDATKSGRPIRNSAHSEKPKHD
jgi:hypothetical protein